MTKFLILHGVGETPNSNWYMWLKGYLIGQQNKVWLPQLPSSSKPETKKFNKILLSNKKFVLDEDTIIIGHSTGGVAALSLLQNMPKNKSVKAAIIVGVFKDYLDWNALDGLYNLSYDFDLIKSHCQKIIFIHSNDDPQSPIEHIHKMVEQTSGELITLENQGNFSISYDDKFKKFPEILNVIETIK